MIPSSLFTAESPAQLNNLKINGPEAWLLIFQPRYIPHQVIRPYIYNFHDAKFIEDVIRDVTVIDSIGLNAPVSQAVGTSIVPSADGIEVNTDPLSACWTFILIVDTIAASGAKVRHISSGFFNEEPINPQTMMMSATPVVNPNAYLHFLSMTTAAINNTVGPASHQMLAVNAAYDLTPHIATTLTQQELFMTDPGSLVQNSHAVNTENSLAMYADAAVGNLRGHSAVIHTHLKSPRQQLREIGCALDAAAAVSQGSSILSNLNAQRNRSSMDMDGLSRFTSIVRDNLRTSMNTSFVPGIIEVTVPISLAQLDSMLPDIHIQCIGIPHNVVGDDRPQMMLVPQNTLSYLVCNTIGAIASGLGIGSIAFRYDSFGNDPFNRGRGVWQVLQVGMVCPTSQELIKEAVDQFMRILTNDLWPVIKYTHGEFCVMVRHDANGETYIDLQLHDFSKIGGIYVANNVLGGLVIPTLGTEQDFIHNACEMGSFVHTLGIRNTPQHPMDDLAQVDGYMSGGSCMVRPPSFEEAPLPPSYV